MNDLDFLEEDDSNEPLFSKEEMKEIEKEVSEEDITLTEMGIIPKIAEHYKQQFNKVILYQGYPTNDFFDYYLDNLAMQKHLDLLLENKDRFRSGQQEKLEKFELEPMIEQSTISEYIDKNRELILENNTLYKKVQELQEERDKLEEDNKIISVINLNVEQLCVHLIQIFRDQKIKANLDAGEIQLIKEMMGSE